MEPTKPAKKAKQEFIELQAGARIECKTSIGGKERKYFVNLKARKYEIVEKLDLEIDPYANRIRKSKLEEIRSELQIKG